MDENDSQTFEIYLNNETCTKEYFKENKIIINYIKTILKENENLEYSDIVTPSMHTSVENIKKIINQYQEQSQLLDPYLPEIISLIMNHILKMIYLNDRNIYNNNNNNNNNLIMNNNIFPCQKYNNKFLHLLFVLITLLCKVRGYKTIIKLFPHQVQDFEIIFSMLKSQDLNDYSTWETRYIFLLWLSILVLIPFDLSTIDSFFNVTNDTNTNMIDNLIIICGLYLSDPGITKEAASFCLARLLSRKDILMGTNVNDAENENHLNIKDNLHVNKPNVPSINTKALNIFFEELNPFFDNFFKLSQHDNNITFRLIGILRTLSHLNKIGDRLRLLEICKNYFQSLLNLVLKLTESNIQNDNENEENSNSSTNNNMLYRKLCMKLMTRIGQIYIKPRVIPWLYKRGKRSLCLSSETNVSNNDSDCLKENKTENNFKTNPNNNQNTYDNDNDIDVPKEIDSIVDVLLLGLYDKSTIVRWSAAKGIGRITNILPYAYAEEIITTIINLLLENMKNNTINSNNMFHGATLALAEMARRGLLLPEKNSNFDSLLLVITPYLLDYESSNTISLSNKKTGENVRDSACYLSWALARAYDPILLSPYLNESLLISLLLTALYDREINCRRAAAAAYQENIGRQGHSYTNKVEKDNRMEIDKVPLDLIKDGISILVEADYYSLSNIRNSYLDVSVHIACFLNNNDEGQNNANNCHHYFVKFIEHLSYKKLFHWSKSIRTLASQAIGKLIYNFRSINNFISFITNDILNFLYENTINGGSNNNIRHGCILGCSEIILALYSTGYCDSSDTNNSELDKKIIYFVIQMDKMRLYRGKNGFYIREAIMRYIECLSIVNVPVYKNKDITRKYLEIIEENIKNPIDTVQSAAIDAFYAFSHQYIGKHNDIMDNKYINHFIDRISYDNEKNVAVRRGFIRTLSVLPYSVFYRIHRIESLGNGDDITERSLLQLIIESLIAAGAIDNTILKSEQDPISRKECIITLISILDTIITDEQSRNIDGILINKIFDFFLESLNDYTTDERGDVGSWIRKESIVALEKLIILLHNGSHKYYTHDKTKLLNHNIKKYQHGNYLLKHKYLGEGKVVGHFGSLKMFQDTCWFYTQFSSNSTITKLVPYTELEAIYNCETNEELFIIPSAEDRLNIDTSSIQDIIPRQSLLTSSMVCQTLQAFSKQMAEKLDSIRLVAGTAFCNLLYLGKDYNNDILYGVPDRFKLEKIFNDYKETQWLTGKNSFSIIVQLLGINELFEPIVEGLIISVGGLTESVVIPAKKALLNYMTNDDNKNTVQFKRKLFSYLNKLFMMYHGVTRVTLPLLKTISMLLENNIFSNDLSYIDYKNDLYEHIKTEVGKSQDIPIMLAAISIVVNLIPNDPETKKKALRGILFFLYHKYPTVRKYMAEQFYTKLLLHENLFPADKKKDIQETKEIMFELIGIEPNKKRKGNDDIVVVEKEKFNKKEGYESLVRDMGY